jgi:peptidoglycan/LPS O-acetylase OafA/YrhL
MQSGTQIEQVPLRQKTYLPSINGGRAIAMFLVFGGHFLSMQFSTPNASVADLYSAGVHRGASDVFLNNFFNFFVPVPMDYFFIISGFVLAWAYRPGTSAPQFWRRRFGKIYPVYFVCELAAFLLFGVLFANWTSWKVVLTHLFMLQSWTPGTAYSLGLDPALWTLSSEAFNYLFFPALMILLLLASKRGLKLVALVMTGLTFLLPWIVTSSFTLLAPPSVKGAAPLAGYSSEFTQWFTVYCPIPRLFQFTLGMTLALLIRKGVRFRINVPVAVILSLGALVLTNFFLPIELSANAGMLIPIALLVVALAQADQKGKRTGLRSRAMQFFGRISYCFYAVHILFVIFTVVQVPVASGAWDFPRLWLYELGVISSPKIALPGWANFLLFFIYLGVSILAAWALNVWVEKPLNRLIRGGSPRSGQAVGPVAVPDAAQAPLRPAPVLVEASASADTAFGAPVNQLDHDHVSADGAQAGQAHFPDTKAS